MLFPKFLHTFVNRDEVILDQPKSYDEIEIFQKKKQTNLIQNAQ